jgi:hypothetical protein
LSGAPRTRAILAAIVLMSAAWGGLLAQPPRAAAAGVTGCPTAVTPASVVDRGTTAQQVPATTLTAPGKLRVFAVQHFQDLARVATYADIYADLDCDLRRWVDPLWVSDRPDVVVYNELNGLMYGTEGSRGALARQGGKGATLIGQLTGQAGAGGIGSVASFYTPELAYYAARFGAPPSSDAAVERLFTAITDTMVRAVVENGSRLARSHHVYLVIGAPLPVVEGAACAGAYAGWRACPGWQRSTSAADITALEDPDLAPAPYVYVARTPNVDNVELVFSPDGTLYDLQPKVNLTPIELSPLGWHQASPATIHAIQLYGTDRVRLPGIRMGVAISLDAFEDAIVQGADPCTDRLAFMQCLDAKGVNVVIQPEFNDGTKDCMSWTDFTEDCGTAKASWQPLSWMRSAWYSVQGRNPDGSFVFHNFRYAVNPFLVGNLFDVAGDGQSAIFARSDPRSARYWYAGDSSARLYAQAGAYTDRADDPRYAPFEGPQPGYLALMPWKIHEGTSASLYRVRTPPLAAGSAGSLQSCEKGLAPGSGITPLQSPNCHEDGYFAGALVADLFPA